MIKSPSKILKKPEVNIEGEVEWRIDDNLVPYEDAIKFMETRVEEFEKIMNRRQFGFLSIRLYIQLVQVPWMRIC